MTDIFKVGLVAIFLASLSLAVLVLAYPEAEQPVTVTAKVEEPRLGYVESKDTLQVRLVSDEKEVRNVLDEFMVQNPEKGIVTALSIKINDSCVIYALKPEYDNDRRMTIMGHEISHCFGMTHD